MQAAQTRIHFCLRTPEELTLFPMEGVRVLDWHADIAMIRRFYMLWGEGASIDPPQNEPEVGAPFALVRDGEILSFTIPFHFKAGEVELGAVATAPAVQNRGYCRSVLSLAAQAFLREGKRVTLTTGGCNLAMQAAARAIGMRVTGG